MVSRINPWWMELSGAPDGYERLWKSWGRPGVARMLQLCAIEGRAAFCAWTVMEALSSEESVRLSLFCAERLEVEPQVLRDVREWLSLRKADPEWLPKLNALAKDPLRCHAWTLLRAAYSTHNFLGDEWLCCALLCVEAVRRRCTSWAELAGIVGSFGVQPVSKCRGKRRKKSWTTI